MIIAYVDGLCEPANPGGVACWGYVVYKDGVKLLEGRGVIGEGKGMSNNLAEYTALKEVLLRLKERGLHSEDVAVRSDSRLLVNQMTGCWEAHGGLYYPAYIEAVRLAQLFPKVRFAWIPREMNAEADGLSRQAYEEYCRQRGRKVQYHTLKEFVKR